MTPDPLLTACAKALAPFSGAGFRPEQLAAAVLRIARPMILEEAAKVCEEKARRCAHIREDNDAAGRKEVGTLYHHKTQTSLECANAIRRASYDDCMLADSEAALVITSLRELGYALVPVGLIEEAAGVCDGSRHYTLAARLRRHAAAAGEAL